MCNVIQVKTNMHDLGKRFRATVANPDQLLFADEIIGFAFKPSVVIANDNLDIIATDYHWGLIPSWSKDDAIRKQTLNARIETLDEKPSFRNVTENRCLVIATAFFEWRWNDPKGKSKTKYEIHSAENEIFSFAGIYSTWKNPTNNEMIKTFSIVTTQANEQMQYIHNMKQRMPIVLKEKDENDWLNPKVPFETFAYPNYSPELLAFES